MAIDINKILDEARALGCSDLHFTVGIPPIVRPVSYTHLTLPTIA